MKIVIVGGVAGGATAAARIRRLDEQGQIIVFERSDMFPMLIADFHIILRCYYRSRSFDAADARKLF